MARRRDRNRITAAGSATRPGDTGQAQPTKVALLVPLSAHGQSGIIGKSFAGCRACPVRARQPERAADRQDDKARLKARLLPTRRSRAALPILVRCLPVRDCRGARRAPADVSVIAFSNDRQWPATAFTPELPAAQGDARRRSCRPAGRGLRADPDDAFGKIVSASFTEAVSRVGGTRRGHADLPAAGPAGGRRAAAQGQRIQAASRRALTMPCSCRADENLEIIADRCRRPRSIPTR
jgi:hypothetical protein